jgi:hypothetical protein
VPYCELGNNVDFSGEFIYTHIVIFKNIFVESYRCRRLFRKIRGAWIASQSSTKSADGLLAVFLLSLFNHQEKEGGRKNGKDKEERFHPSAGGKGVRVLFRAGQLA